MILYWFDQSAFCPKDKGLLKKEGQIVLDVYGCPNCTEKYVRLRSSTVDYPVSSISDGLIRPRKIYSPKQQSAIKPAMILTMKNPT